MAYRRETDLCVPTPLSPRGKRCDEGNGLGWVLKGLMAGWTASVKVEGKKAV
jgi:hypothetical protein